MLRLEVERAMSARAELMTSIKESKNEKPKSQLRWLSRILRLLFFFACAAYVVLTFRSLLSSYDWSELTYDWRWLVGALPFCSLGLYFQYRAWWGALLVLQEPSDQMPKGLRETKALLLYLQSQLARYTPGKVGLPAVRIAGAQGIGFGRRPVALSILSELFSWLMSGSLVSLAVLLLLKDESIQSVTNLLRATLSSSAFRCVVGLVGLGLLSSLLFLTRPLQRQPRWLQRLWLFILRKSQQADEMMHEQRQWLLSRPIVSRKTLGFHLIYWLLLVVMSFCVVRGLGVSPTDSFYAAGGAPIAILGGFFALFAPGGAGIREAILSTLSLPFLGPTLALSFSLLLRFISITVEICFFLTLRVVRRNDLD